MGKTILFVDKDASFVDRMQLQQKYTRAGYHILRATDETDAEQAISAGRPDLVVTEVMLKRPDGGFTLAWKIKKQYPDVPVLIVSSVSRKTGIRFDLSTPEARSWIKADAYLDKPVREEELDAAIRNLLHQPAPV